MKLLLTIGNIVTKIQQAIIGYIIHAVVDVLEEYSSII